MYDAQFNPFAQNITIVKDYFKRIPVLVLAILHFLGIVISILMSYLLSVLSNRVLSEVLRQLDSESSSVDISGFRSIVGASSASSVLSLVPSLIIGVLVTVGLLLLFFKSRSSNPSSSPRAGAMILFVVSLIEMILAIIFSVFLLVVMVSMLILALSIRTENTTPQAYLLSGFLIGAVIGTLCYLILTLIYSINKMRYYKGVKNSLSSVQLYSGGAGAYGVFNIIFAVFSFLMAILLLLIVPLQNMIGNNMLASLGLSSAQFFSSDMSVMMILAALSYILSGVTMIFEAIVALGYKKYMNKIRFGYYKPETPVSYQPAVQQNTYQPVSQPQPAVQQPVQPQNTQNTVKQGVPQFNSDEIDLVMPDGYNSFSCPKCHLPVSSDAAFCPKCGQKLK